MKTTQKVLTKYLFYLLLSIYVLSTPGCKKFLDVNEDPNNPVDAAANGRSFDRTAGGQQSPDLRQLFRAVLDAEPLFSTIQKFGAVQAYKHKFRPAMANALPQCTAKCTVDH